MDFPRPSVSPSNIIGDLKDRLGFGNTRHRSYEDDAYYDGYDDYGYDDIDYDQEGSYSSSASADPYDRLEYTTRTTAARPSRTSSYSASPHLVSSSDIRATTSAYGVSPSATTSSFNRSASVSSGHASDSIANSYTASSGAKPSEPEQYDIPATGYGEFVSPYKDRSNQGATTSSSRSAGLDSLFVPHDKAESASEQSDAQAQNSTTSSSREIVLLQPLAYEDVESVARSVKLGSIVVLSLRSTDAALSKRVLDFSFGVASALDARVECVAKKTFVIVKGKDLTLEEHHRLQKQGII